MVKTWQSYHLQELVEINILGSFSLLPKLCSHTTLKDLWVVSLQSEERKTSLVFNLQRLVTKAIRTIHLMTMRYLSYRIWLLDNWVNLRAGITVMLEPATMVYLYSRKRWITRINLSFHLQVLKWACFHLPPIVVNLTISAVTEDPNHLSDQEITIKSISKCCQVQLHRVTRRLVNQCLSNIRTSKEPNNCSSFTTSRRSTSKR